jgi:toxin ParE1/3/4
MKLAWSPEAIDDLASLRAYISVDDPAVAKRIAPHIIHRVAPLKFAGPRFAAQGPTCPAFIPPLPEGARQPLR